MMRGPLPHGVWPYLVSPISDDGTVKDTVLKQLVEDLIVAGVHGLTALGSTGEIMYLTPNQRRSVVLSTLIASAGRVPVVAGVSAYATYDAVQQAKSLEPLGVSGIVAMQQQGGATSEQGVIDYFRAIADSVSCPIIVYTNPAVLGNALSIESITQLAEHENISYLKDATGDLGRILSITNALGNRIGVFSASAHIPLFVSTLGGVGWMAGPACVIPRAAVRLMNECETGDFDELLRLQRGIWPVNEVFRRYPIAACMKAALEIRGYHVGRPVAPQAALPESAYSEISEALRNADDALLQYADSRE